MKLWSQRATAALVGVLLGVLVLETGLRAIWPQEDIYLYELRDGYVFHRPNFDNPFSQSLFASVSTLHRNSFFRHFGPEYLWQPLFDETKVRRRTNARGELDDQQHAAKNESGRFRILNLGGCMGSSWPVELEHSWLKGLERRLPGTETINCAMVGINLPEQVGLYERQCQDYDVDLVILSVNTSQPGDGNGVAEIWGGPQSRLIGVLSTIIGSNLPLQVAKDERGVLRLRADALTPELTALMRDFYEPELPLYHQGHVLRFIENRWLAPSQSPLGQRELIASMFGDTDGPARGETGPLTLSYYTALHERVTARGARLLIAFLPFADRTAAALSGAPAHPVLERNKQALTARGIEWVDLLDTLPRDVPPEALYQDSFTAGLYPSERGYTWFADTLAGVIRERYLGRAAGSAE